MLTARFVLRGLCRRNNSAPPILVGRNLSSVTKKGDDEEKQVSPVEEKLNKMRKSNPHQIYGVPGNHMPMPILPSDPKEVVALDPADKNHRTRMDGSPRVVIVRPMESSAVQSPLQNESQWKLDFSEDGEMMSEKWINPLMGWTSTADPYQADPELVFNNAAEAVYFAKKQGWKYIVKEPILRTIRDDDCQYQDNFLPQAVANLVARQGASCKHWERQSSGTSHYMRPLTYHGDGVVPQHGPNGNAPTAPHVKGYYKSR